MGSQTFKVRVLGLDAKNAFRYAVQQAQYDHGHSGYTGTIAEKYEFVMIPCLGAKFIDDVVQKYIDDSDKRDPAGCIEIEPGKYLFFGWASS